jgi:hypothetical protein
MLTDRGYRNQHRADRAIEAAAPYLAQATVHCNDNQTTKVFDSTRTLVNQGSLNFSHDKQYQKREQQKATNESELTDSS